MMRLGKNIVTSEQVSNFKQVNKQKLANFKKYIYILGSTCWDYSLKVTVPQWQEIEKGTVI